MFRKRTLAFLLIFCAFLTSIPRFSFADSQIKLPINSTASEDSITPLNADYFYWRIDSLQDTGVAYAGDWVLEYVGYPAARTGEVDTISVST